MRAVASLEVRAPTEAVAEVVGVVPLVPSSKLVPPVEAVVLEVVGARVPRVVRQDMLRWDSSRCAPQVSRSWIRRSQRMSAARVVMAPSVEPVVQEVWVALGRRVGTPPPHKPPHARCPTRRVQVVRVQEEGREVLLVVGQEVPPWRSGVSRELSRRIPTRA